MAANQESLRHSLFALSLPDKVNPSSWWPLKKKPEEGIKTPETGEKEEIRPPEINEEELAENILLTYFGHDQWRAEHPEEIQKRGLEEKLTDVTLIEPRSLIISLSRSEALERFRKSFQVLEQAGSNLTPDLVYVRNELEATICYLEEEEKPVTEQLPLSEYLRKTVHLEPRLISRLTFSRARGQLITLLRSAGFLSQDKDDNPSLAKAFKAFQEAKRITDWPTLREQFHDNDELINKYLIKKNFGKKPIPPHSIERVQVDDWWKCEAIRDRNGYQLRINYTPKTSREWIEGMALRYVLHELVAHLGMDAALQKRIVTGEINRAAGVHTLCSPGSYGREGLAQTIHEFLGLKVSLEFRISHAENRLRMLYITHGLTLLERGENPEAIAREIAEFYPFKSVKAIQEELLSTSLNVLNRVLRPVYGIAALDFESICKQLNPKQRHEFIKQIFPRYSLGPQDVKEVFEAVKQGKTAASA